MIRRASLGRALLCAVAGAASVACAGFSLEELPPEPIAFIYRTADEGRERAELLDPEARPSPQPGRSIVRLQQVEGYLGKLSGETENDRLVDTMGKLALFHPRTGEVERLGVAQRGSRPVDWSPDHRQLYFSSLRRGRPQVFAYEIETGSLERVTSGADAHGYASTAPDGRVVFARVVGTREEPRSRLWLRDRDGSLRPVTDGPTDYRPRFSPDGSCILYSSYTASGGPGIFRIDPNSDEPARLVARGIDPDFAPDGTWAVYSQKLKGRWQIWRMNPDGTGKHAIGGAPNAVEKLDAVHPSVSPDGRYIVYVSEETGRQRLRVRRVDGSGDRPLLEGADGGNPVW